MTPPQPVPIARLRAASPAAGAGGRDEGAGVPKRDTRLGRGPSGVNAPPPRQMSDDADDAWPVPEPPEVQRARRDTPAEIDLVDRSAVDERRASRAPLTHDGLVLTAAVGTLGCTRAICRGGSGLASSPGVQVDAFLGGNVGGFVELGIAGGWGKIEPHGVEGRNLAELYGFDPSQARMLADELDFDLDRLQIDSADSQAAHGGVRLRVHFVPRGRVSVYGGSGVGYSLYRSEFTTTGGPARLDFHGLSVPIEGGLAVHVHAKVAIAGQFDYMWTHYMAVHGVLPEQQAVAPMGILDQQLEKLGENLSDDLPHFWSATVGLRVTI